MTLADEIFGLEPREDILQRVRALAVCQAATGARTRPRAVPISRAPGAKMYRQKGTGPRSSLLGTRTAVPAAAARPTAR